MIQKTGQVLVRTLGRKKARDFSRLDGLCQEV